MQKTVVAATDYTDRGNNAARRAAEISDTLGLPYHLLHAMAGDIPDRLEIPIYELRERELARLAKEIGDEYSIEVVQSLRPKPAWQAILEYSDNVEAELIVMGPHRYRGMMDLFQGTTIQRVATHSGAALLLAQMAANHTWQKIVMATDFSASSRAALEFTLELAPKAKLEVIHVIREPLSIFPIGMDVVSRAEGDMQTFLGGLERHAGRLTPRVHAERRGRGFVEILEEKRPDLIAVGTHSRSTLHEALLGSQATRVMTEAVADVLAVPPAYKGFV